MRSDRWLAYAMGLALSMLQALLSLGSPAEAASPRALEGVLTVVWGDPRGAHHGGHLRFDLALPDGRRIPLDIPADDRSAAVTHSGERVRIFGDVATAPAREGRFAVARIERLAGSETSAAAAGRGIGVKRILFILLRFKGDRQTPHRPAFYRALTEPKNPDASLGLPSTINGFFASASWNKLQFRADIVGVGGLAATDWLTLPGTKLDYAPCGWDGACANTYAIEKDALALVRATGVNIAAYDLLTFTLANDLDCCAWGGSTYDSATAKAYGATWQPPWSQQPSTYVHELGHAIGLPHSGWRYYAYDSPWDEMSQGAPTLSEPCGRYYSFNDAAARRIYCSDTGGGYITPHKRALGWLPDAAEFVFDRRSTRIVFLEAAGLPLGTGKKMIRICIPDEPCSGPAAHYLAAEARLTEFGSDGGLPGDGVLIHDVRMNRHSIGIGDPCFFNAQSGWAVPIDARPGDWNAAPQCNALGHTYPDVGLFNAQFTAGTKLDLLQRWGLMVEVGDRAPTGYAVKVTRTR